MSHEPRFLPPPGMPLLQLAGTDGHTCVIYPVDPADDLPGTIIPARFRGAAIAACCLVVGIDLGEADQAGTVSSKDLVRQAIEAVLARDNPDELEGDGRPRLAAVKKQAGFGVTKLQLDEAWTAYTDDLGEV